MPDPEEQTAAIQYFSTNAESFHRLYDGPPEFREREELWQRLLDRYAQAGGVSIDMGCGSGILSFYLATKGGLVIGIDGAPDMIALCETQRQQLGVSNVHFREGSLPLIEERGLGPADLLTQLQRG